MLEVETVQRRFERHEIEADFCNKMQFWLSQTIQQLECLPQETTAYTECILGPLTNARSNSTVLNHLVPANRHLMCDALIM